MSTSRRELIASFLGLAVADLACRKGPAPAELPGGLVDEELLRRGHQLRQGPPALAPEVERTVDVLVVGAGAAGLSAAWRLVGAGVAELLVVELDRVEGGTAQAGRNEVSAYPWGAHYLPAPLTAAGPVPRLLKELGVLTGVDATGSPTWAEQTLIHEPEERLFYRGYWYEGLYLRVGASAEDLAQLERFLAQMRAFASAVDGKGRKAFAVPTASGSDDAEWTALDRLSMAQWLELQRFDSPRLKWLVEYACLDDFGSTAADTSAWAGIWYFSARQSGDEKNDGYLSWPEGNGHLIRQLSRAVPSARLRRDLLVHTVEAGPAGWTAHGLDASTGRPVQVRARQVILACPRHVAARVVAAWRSAPPAFLKQFHTSPWVVANLTLSRRPTGRGFPLAWDNVLYESKSIGYVVATHQAARADEHGPTVLTWYCPLPGDPTAERTRLLGTTWAQWQQVILADLGAAHRDVGSLVTRLEVMRWGHAMVKPRPGFIFGGARQLAQQSLDGSLHFAHTDLGGLALFEEANHFGVLAAERALAGLGRRVESWL